MEGTGVYIPHEHLTWVKAQVLSVEQDGKLLVVRIDDPSYFDSEWNDGTETLDCDLRRIGLDSLPLQNVNLPENGVDDMTSLNYLHEASIMDNLRHRFFRQLPYTYTGDITVAVNPYRWLDIYSEDLRETYTLHHRNELAPHVYSTSANAYRGVRDYAKDQSILVSGESGAGKTETVKILLNHLAHISGSKDDVIVARVLQSNPLLESFGNAKTTRNDNSSRFGKFTMLQFNEHTLLVGSECITYLLEKSRTVHQNENERNYHIFHELIRAPDEHRARYHLEGTEVQDFFYMSNGDVHTEIIEGRSDTERFLDTIRTMRVINISEEDIENAMRIIAGILYTGQINVQALGGDNDKSELVDGDGLRLATELLNVDRQAYATSLTERTVTARNEVYKVPLTPIQAVDARDATSKELYHRLFRWLVSRINSSTAISKKCKHKISLLDIFGFESFAVNRFEQLCINFANEKLQQKFTQDVFKTVQQEYNAEGLPWEHISYKDNADVLELIEGRMGVITYLNEECMRPQGADSSLLNKLKQVHGSHVAFFIDRRNPEVFGVRHYAGLVCYTVNGFLDKNKDSLLDDISDTLSRSSNSLIRTLFGPAYTAIEAASGAVLDSGKRKGAIVKETVTTKFKDQLKSLMEAITRTQVQYVRCVKPNSNKSSTELNTKMVVEQLRCAGMIEAIRISRAAYPNRLTHGDFIRRFSLLSSKSSSKVQIDPKKAMDECRKLLELLLRRGNNQIRSASGELLDVEFAVGRTKVYFGKGVLEFLEDERSRLLSDRVVCIQRYSRGYVQRVKFLRLRNAAIHIQSQWRCFRSKTLYGRQRGRIIKLQTLYRMKLAKLKLRFLKHTKAAIRIQSAYRGMKFHKTFNRNRKAALKTQQMIKRFVNRLRFKRALRKARENAKLENQLEQLKKRLKEESDARTRMEEEAAKLRAAGPVTIVVEKEVPAQSPVRDNLAEESERLLDVLKNEIKILKDEAEVRRQETEALKADNRKKSEAHDTVGAAAAQLNQHAKQLKAANDKLSRENEHLQKEVKRLKREKEHLVKTVINYTQELDAKEKAKKTEATAQHKTMLRMLDVARQREVKDDIIEELHAIVAGFLASPNGPAVDSDTRGGPGAAAGQSQTTRRRRRRRPTGVSGLDAGPSSPAKSEGSKVNTAVVAVAVPVESGSRDLQGTAPVNRAQAVAAQKGQSRRSFFSGWFGGEDENKPHDNI